MRGVGGATSMSSMRQLDDDRILDWHEELRRIQTRFADLPVEARQAVLRVVERFRAEDAASRGRAA